MVKYLLQELPPRGGPPTHGLGTDVHRRGAIGETPLHWASETQPQIVLLLLARGEDADGRNVKFGTKFEGYTPLIWCASQPDDSAECASLLLAAGADPAASDAAGRNAAAWSKLRGTTRVGAVLRK